MIIPATDPPWLCDVSCAKLLPPLGCKIDENEEIDVELCLAILSYISIFL